MSDAVAEVDIAIIGAGAAGLFCGACLGGNGLNIAILEHNKSVGRKILISGGGRCNFTNIYTGPENFHGENPHFHKSSLARYFPSDFIDLLERYQVDYYEKTLGQLFCRESAKDVVRVLTSECEKGGVAIMRSVRVLDLLRDKKQQSFEIVTSQGLWRAKKVVVASGGLSLSQLGATDIGHKIAKKFKHKIVPTAPALVPLTLDQKDWGLDNLSGVSLDVEASTERGPSFRESLLFTHRGLSGPVILQVSSYWRAKEKITINFSPDKDIEQWLLSEMKVNGARQLKSMLKTIFPERFIFKWLKDVGLPADKKLAELGRKDLDSLKKVFHHWEVVPLATEGHRKAEVTRGGVCTDELSSKNLESKYCPGLYFIGEVVDVTGWLGGFNFQWAWASAFACANHLKSDLS